MDTIKKPNLARRKALIGGTAGVAAVTAWHTPILNSVILPAHAQMSVTSFFGSASTGGITKSFSPLDLLLEPAYAGGGGSSGTVYTVVVARIGEPGTSYEVGVHTRTLMVSDFVEVLEVVYKGTVDLGVEKFIGADQNPCNLRLKDLLIEVTADNGDSIDVTFPAAGLDVNVPQADGMLPDAACTLGIADNYFDASAIPSQDEASSSSKENFSPLDLFIEPAHALLVVGLSAERDPNGFDYVVTYRDSGGPVLRVGTLTPYNDPSPLFVTDNPCEVAWCDSDGSVNASIDSVDTTEMTITIEMENGGPTSFTIPAAAIGALSVSCG